jgi:hypothetical protein
MQGLCHCLGVMAICEGGRVPVVSEIEVVLETLRTSLEADMKPKNM